MMNVDVDVDGVVDVVVVVVTGWLGGMYQVSRGGRGLGFRKG